MRQMTAYQVTAWGKPAEFVEVPVPSPAPGEVLIKMKGAGLCRSDLDIMDQRAGSEPYACVLPAGFTLGHENAGIVEQVGAGVVDLKEGDGVVVHHMHSCGFCDFCQHGIEQSCTSFARGAVSFTRGVGIDGGLAPYLLAPRHELVAIGNLDPVHVAPLTDAGVTAYRAVQGVIARLRPGSNAVVIGVGGLGYYGVQFLKLMTTAKIFALDISPERLAIAKSVGADEVLPSNAQAAERILDLTRGRGADAIIDFVGTDGTLALAARVSRPQGRIVLVGMEGGTLKVGWGTMATSCEFAISMGSTRADLSAVCHMAAQGQIQIDSELFKFSDVETAYARLRAGKLRGRAVVTFD
jgi:alcohol dehydrogenase, propanol-preferring